MSASITSPSGKPLVSILMPTYNAEDTIAAAIRSVLAQTRSEWELIVMDDGSTDSTLKIARELAATDPRILVLTQLNTGVGQARNNAAAHASSEMFALLDSDDEYLPQYLERMFVLVQRVPDRDLYSCNGYYVFSNGMRTRVRKGSEWTHEREFTAEEMLDGGPVFIPAMFRKSAFYRVGGFRRRIVEDYDLWIRILLTGGRHIYTP
ncbi:MAG: glycosyltransferase [Coriobacteriia bacterium]|nr:glycosyltransferase [Coriobacteriia bacterium]